jgi:nitroreductase
VAIAIDHMTLTAVELGLGTCWVGAFHEDQAKKILNISREIRVVELLALGYPKESQNLNKDRLGLRDIVFKESWSKRYF